MSKPIVYIVHAVDVEGPMTETLEATFERMWSFGLPRTVAVSAENLELIKKGRLPGIPESLAQKLLGPFNDHLLNYWGDWSAIDKMLLELNSPAYRSKYCSKNGEPYVLSWFIYDHHEEFQNNPRFHAVGTHTIFDHYMNLFLDRNPHDDGIYWHYHHAPVNGDALGSNTSWSSMVAHESVVSKRIIDKSWYFSVFRAGLHIERNDLSHWLEMYIPFDFSARYAASAVYRPGIEFDWRESPSRWGGWHPDWYDYRKEGAMRRWLFRSTDLRTYLSSLKEDEVEDAFLQARRFGDSVLTYYNHDYRDMRVEIEAGYRVIRAVAARHPEVDYRFVSALEAAQKHLKLEPSRPKLSLDLQGNILHVSSQGDIFGPQPYLAVQEGTRYFRDNFTAEGGNRWAYEIRYPEQTVAIGVAASGPSGLHDVQVLKLKTERS